MANALACVLVDARTSALAVVRTFSDRRVFTVCDLVGFARSVDAQSLVEKTPSLMPLEPSQAGPILSPGELSDALADGMLLPLRAPGPRSAAPLASPGQTTQGRGRRGQNRNFATELPYILQPERQSGSRALVRLGCDAQRHPICRHDLRRRRRGARGPAQRPRPCTRGKRLRAPPLSRHHASSTIRYAAGATPAQAVCCWRGAARRRGGPARVVTGVPLPRPCRGARTTAARPPRPSAHLPRAQCRTRVRRSRTRVGLRPGAAMGDALRPWEGPRLQVRGVLGRRCVGHAEAAEVLLERLQASIS